MLQEQNSPALDSILNKVQYGRRCAKIECNTVAASQQQYDPLQSSSNNMINYIAASQQQYDQLQSSNNMINYIAASQHNMINYIAASQHNMIIT